MVGSRVFVDIVGDDVLIQRDGTERGMAPLLARGRRVAGVSDRACTRPCRHGSAGRERGKHPTADHPTIDALMSDWQARRPGAKNGAGPEITFTRRAFLRRGDATGGLTSEAFELSSGYSLEAEKAMAEARALLRLQERATLPAVEKADHVLLSGVTANMVVLRVSVGADGAALFTPRAR